MIDIRTRYFVLLERLYDQESSAFENSKEQTLNSQSVSYQHLTVSGNKKQSFQIHPSAKEWLLVSHLFNYISNILGSLQLLIPSAIYGNSVTFSKHISSMCVALTEIYFIYYILRKYKIYMMRLSVYRETSCRESFYAFFARQNVHYIMSIRKIMLTFCFFSSPCCNGSRNSNKTPHLLKKTSRFPLNMRKVMLLPNWVKLIKIYQNSVGAKNFR